GAPVIVHCCDTRPPIALLRAAGAGAIAFDATTVDGAPGALLDELGEAWDDGTVLLLGLVPTRQPEQPVTPKELVQPAFNLADRLGYARCTLAERAIATSQGALAGESEW